MKLLEDREPYISSQILAYRVPTNVHHRLLHKRVFPIREVDVPRLHDPATDTRGDRCDGLDRGEHTTRDTGGGASHVCYLCSNILEMDVVSLGRILAVRNGEEVQEGTALIVVSKLMVGKGHLASYRPAHQGCIRSFAAPPMRCFW